MSGGFSPVENRNIDSSTARAISGVIEAMTHSRARSGRFSADVDTGADDLDVGFAGGLDHAHGGGASDGQQDPRLVDVEEGLGEGLGTSLVAEAADLIVGEIGQLDLDGRVDAPGAVGEAGDVAVAFEALGRPADDGQRQAPALAGGHDAGQVGAFLDRELHGPVVAGHRARCADALAAEVGLPGLAEAWLGLVEVDDEGGLGWSGRCPRWTSSRHPRRR